MRISKRTSKLLHEAIMAAYIEGSRQGPLGDLVGDEYPTAHEIVSHVLAASVTLAEIYPTLSKTHAAQAADVERRRRSAALRAVVGDGEALR